MTGVPERLWYPSRLKTGVYINYM